MADRDILFVVRNAFYLGSYNNAINEASDLEGLTDAEQTERDALVYRSYIALGSYDVSVAALCHVLGPCQVAPELTARTVGWCCPP